MIETIVYLVILAILTTMVISLLLSMTKSFYRFQANRRLAHTTEVLLSRLEQEIRQADNVDVINSVLGSHPGKLVLNTTDGSGGATTVEFILNAGAVLIREGSSAYATTTDANVDVSQLIFRSVGTSASEAIRVELTLDDQGSADLLPVNFYTTAVLRGSY